jgi:hypothetical protein
MRMMTPSSPACRRSRAYFNDGRCSPPATEIIGVNNPSVAVSPNLYTVGKATPPAKPDHANDDNGRCSLPPTALVKRVGKRSRPIDNETISTQ